MYVNLNGRILQEEEAHISPSNRSFRYGDGCFETMKMLDGKIILQELHLQRLFYSLLSLQFEIPKQFTSHSVIENIYATAKGNRLSNARVRLTMFRGDGGLYDVANLHPNFLIQVYPLENITPTLNSNGLVVGIYKDAIKAADNFSSIKSNNFLPYTQAALWAKTQRLNDAILLNQYSTVADATIANVFVVTNGVIQTPPLSDGPIDGVMRRYLLRQLQQDGYSVKQQSIPVEDLLNSSEVFFTNAIQGIRWVRQIEKSNFTCDLTAQLYNKYIIPLFR